MEGVYTRIGTYSCSRKRILTLNPFFFQKQYSKFTFLCTPAPSLCARRQVLASSAAFCLEKELSVKCAKGQLSLLNRDRMFPHWLWGIKRLKILPALGIPNQACLGGYKLWKFESVAICASQNRNFKEEIPFLALISAPLILPGDVTS